MQGADGAFGWYQGARCTLGGLQPGAAYQVVCEGGELTAMADGRGNWQGRLTRGAPLCVALGRQVVLHDGERLSREAAQLLLDARRTPPPKRNPAPVPDPVPEKETESEKKPEPEKRPAVHYRQPSDGMPADALPVLSWPAAARQLKAVFEKNRPRRVLDLPGWRMVQAQEAGMQCCFGYRTAGDRVAEVLYGVRARGSLIPPKGLQGYRYERGVDGSGWWVLRQTV